MKRAEFDADERVQEDGTDELKALKGEQGEKIKLKFGSKRKRSRTQYHHYLI